MGRMASGDGKTRAIGVGITGHRKLGADPRVGWFVHTHCVLTLDHLRSIARMQQADFVAYSALAIGADQLFAQAALGLGVPLVGVIPFEQYHDDFDGEDRLHFETLLSQCSRVHRLPNKRRSLRAYLDVGKWIVDQVDYLVAVWNGLPAQGKGGTGDIVAYAARRKRPVLRIDPAAAHQATFRNDKGNGEEHALGSAHE
jgi:hypothetical protein